MVSLNPNPNVAISYIFLFHGAVSERLRVVANYLRQCAYRIIIGYFPCWHVRRYKVGRFTLRIAEIQQNMKKFLSIVLLSLLATGVARALPIYVGSITDGIPSNEANEAGWVSQLITLAPNATNVASNNPAGEDLDRSSAPITWPITAVTFSKKEAEATLDLTPLVTGYSFILAKYGASAPGGQQSLVYYVNGHIGEFTLPVTQGLSHVTYFGGGTSVPDAGASIALLGLGLLVLAAIRRKLA
jgi:hypothetical protein